MANKWRHVQYLLFGVRIPSNWAIRRIKMKKKIPIQIFIWQFGVIALNTNSLINEWDLRFFVVVPYCIVWFMSESWWQKPAITSLNLKWIFNHKIIKIDVNRKHVIIMFVSCFSAVGTKKKWTKLKFTMIVKLILYRFKRNCNCESVCSWPQMRERGECY